MEDLMKAQRGLARSPGFTLAACFMPAPRAGSFNPFAQYRQE
jgi:hypothetical protein